MVEQKIVIKDYEFFILAAKEEGEKNAKIAKRFIQYVNENPLSELRAINVVNQIPANGDL